MQFTELDLILWHKFRIGRPVLVDVGAHQGSFSEPFARRGWRVVAFEPERENRAKYEEVMRRFGRTQCLPQAVSLVSEEMVPFYVSDEHPGIHSLKSFHPTHRLAYEVETVRLDDALDELDVEEVTLLKIDIEGADYLALQSFDFERWRPQLVMVEFMDERSLPFFSYDHHEMVSFMRKWRYEAFVSEWESIVEYGGRDGEANHQWIRCTRYSADGEPAWGNLIFVPREHTDQFTSTLRKYLRYAPKWSICKKIVKTIPGVRRAYKFLQVFRDATAN